ncbi:MAG: CoA pyrophosphatase [Pseudomonadota bacterium]
MTLTEALLEACFRDTRLPQDPTRVELPGGTDRWPSFLADKLADTLKPAGVLIPVMRRADGFHVLLTRRSAELKHHAGQVSFPGGRMEDEDKDIADTALRETHEEVGIPPRDVRVIGYLRPTPTFTGYAVTPTIGLIDGAVELNIDASEVESAFEVPLEFLLDPENYSQAEREFQGRRFPVLEVRYDGQHIWGATAYMLSRFIKIIKNNR